MHLNKLADIGVSYADVSYILNILGAILAIIGATIIYRNWSAGKQDIDRDVMNWGGGVLFFLLIQVTIKLLFY